MAGIVSGKVALVTGGGRGIGRAIALALAQDGARVVVCDIGASLQGAGTDANPAQQVVDEIKAAGGEAIASTLSITEPKNAEEIVKAALTAFGRVDILVNNAGVIRDGLFLRMDSENWNTVLQTNLNGTFYFCRAVADQMALKQRSGRIINVSSVAADHVNAGQTNYAASKGAINAFTRALAVELASRGVTVNAIAPGFVETEMTEAVRNKAGDLIKKMIPMKRLGKPEDIARVAVFLAGPEASYITGQVITVDGGLSLGAVAV